MSTNRSMSSMRRAKTHTGVHHVVANARFGRTERKGPGQSPATSSSTRCCDPVAYCLWPDVETIGTHLPAAVGSDQPAFHVEEPACALRLDRTVVVRHGHDDPQRPLHGRPAVGAELSYDLDPR